jgi:hypothetical protein
MRKSSKAIAAVAVAAAVAAGGAAFTSSNTFATGATAPRTGYGSTDVTGGTIDSLHYNLSTDGSNVNSVALVLAGDTTLSAVSIGFNGLATTSCGTGTFAATETTYTCDNGGASFTQSTDTLNSTAVVIN